MLSTLKKWLILLLLTIILLGGGVWFFFRSKNTTSNQNLSNQEKDWENISNQFKEDSALIAGWKSHDFNYDQTHEWINIGLSPIDFPFAAWLRDKKKLNPEEVLNHGNEKNLREEWINEEDGEGKIAKLKTDIISRLNIWLTDYTAWGSKLLGEEQKETQEAVRKTIKDLRNSELNNSQQLNSLKDLLDNHYQFGEDTDSDSLDDETDDFSTTKVSQNYQKLLELVQQWKELEEEPAEWFSEKRQLTSEEIDWANQQIKKSDKHGRKIKILPSEQFSLVREAEGQEYDSLFSKLLSDLQDKEIELVFIPVKGSNSHWSLLIYERVTELFYHYDINEGDNFEYSNPLLADLLSQIKPSLKNNIDEEWWRVFVKICLGRKQENEHNSGIAVISLIQRIIQLYNSNFRLTSETVTRDNEKYTVSKSNLGLVVKNLGEFNFFEERKLWQERYSNK